jgi:hypothetical protein
MIMNNKLLLLFLLFFSLFGPELFSQKKFLFDATKSETAGNADWVIDTDTKNTPQRFPTPDQSTVTASTPETYWTGALSSWGIALVKLGHHVETLPKGTAITYGNTANAQDLSNYNVYIVDEPNNQFSASEKTAMMNFIQNGGGLFMISDHTVSDRDNDGWDSPKVWNDFFTANGVKVNPFGISVDLANFSQLSTNALSASSGDPLISGPQGTVLSINYSNGTSFTLDPASNSSVKGVLWKNGATQGNASVLVAHATYGKGRVVIVGDSSPADDGTGESGKSLYTGWAGEANGDHARLHLNASLWLAQVTGVNDVADKQTMAAAFALEQNYPNPFNPTTTINYRTGEANSKVTLIISDVLGKQVANLVNEIQNAGMHSVQFNAGSLPSGIYFYTLRAGNNMQTKKLLLLK